MSPLATICLELYDMTDEIRLSMSKLAALKYLGEDFKEEESYLLWDSGFLTKYISGCYVPICRVDAPFALAHMEIPVSYELINNTLDIESTFNKELKSTNYYNW